MDGHAAGRATSRRGPRRLLIALTVVVALCVVAAAGGYGYFRWRFDQIGTHTFAQGVLNNNGSDDPGAPMNVLLVGSDTRADLQGADCRRNCRDEHGNLVTGQRSDTIMVLHADPRAKRGAILSIPRDLWVTIAGGGQRNRINSAFEAGPDRLVRTVTDTLGIPIDHYVQVDFVSFRGLVNALGGVTVYFPAPARDRYSDLDVAKAGCVALNGDQALAYVRSRHYTYYESGRWRTDPTSDFGRIQRQQDFIRRLMKKALSRGITNPITLNRMIGIATKNLQIDSAMSSKDIVRLGRQFHSLDPNSVPMYTLPTVPTVIGGADVLLLKQPQAKQVVDLFLGNVEPPGATGGTTAAAGVLPDAVQVRVLNGSGIAGLAGRAASQLSGYGFQVTGTGDADKFDYAGTVVRYGKGQRAKALLVRSYLKGGAQLTEDTTLTVDVSLVLGRSYTGLAKPIGSAAATTPSPTSGSSTSSVPGSVPTPKGAPLKPQC